MVDITSNFYSIVKMEKYLWLFQQQMLLLILSKIYPRMENHKKI